MITMQNHFLITTKADFSILEKNFRTSTPGAKTSINPHFNFFIYSKWCSALRCVALKANSIGLAILIFFRPFFFRDDHQGVGIQHGRIL